MPSSKSRTEVAVGLIEDGHGRLLMASRPAGKVYAGWWEFSGGKCEPGESASQALERELKEELGIEVLDAKPFESIHYDYSHAQVVLRFFKVSRWQAASSYTRPHAREGQQLLWVAPQGPLPFPVLPASLPVIEALASGA
ncbi:MAG: (deoxy)nucleoside triphosphate pyrophosphohydrolase [Burkholderiaceae bacterium]